MQILFSCFYPVTDYGNNNLEPGDSAPAAGGQWGEVPTLR